jgi:hypothetical protein
MPQTPNRSIEERLARLLEAPSLARAVPHLPPEALHQLIRRHGLDACGELVTSATPAQLTALLDLDLWQPTRPGRAEEFDVARFGEWVEVLVDTSPSLAARTVAALDEDLVVAGLSRYVRVLDPGIFEPVAQSDDERPDPHEAMRDGDAGMDGASGVGLECELGGYVVRARRPDAWDAIVDLLGALDAGHGTHFQAIMQGCRKLSNSTPESDGLDDLLGAPEQQLHDVTLDREHRRSQQGYAVTGDARAFLQMARQPKDGQSRHPIVTAYFRAMDAAPESPSPAPVPMALPSGASAASERGAHDGVPESIDAVLELLAEAGLIPQPPRALLQSADADPAAARLTRLRQLMEYVRDADENAYLARTRELAFLANTLLAGCSVQSRPFTPREASDAAASVCNLGLEYWPAPDRSLVEHSLVTAFEIGWSVLHRDVSLFVARELIATIDALHVSDIDIDEGLGSLRRALARQCETGTPWLAREAAEILAMLDMTAWASVVGLLDECPVVPAAMIAILEGGTAAVSPTAFEFISTAAQIRAVHAFMRKLPDVLSR